MPWASSVGIRPETDDPEKALLVKLQFLEQLPGLQA
jgi:hypothetical protein